MTGRSVRAVPQESPNAGTAATEPAWQPQASDEQYANEELPPDFGEQEQGQEQRGQQGQTGTQSIRPKPSRPAVAVHDSTPAESEPVSNVTDSRSRPGPAQAATEDQPELSDPGFLTLSELFPGRIIEIETPEPTDDDSPGDALDATASLDNASLDNAGLDDDELAPG